jgi:hypothetical protein
VVSDVAHAKSRDPGGRMRVSAVEADLGKSGRAAARHATTSLDAKNTTSLRSLAECLFVALCIVIYARGYSAGIHAKVSSLKRHVYCHHPIAVVKQDRPE